MDIYEEVKKFKNEFFAHGSHGTIIDTVSDAGEPIEDYFARKLKQALEEGKKQ